MRRSAALFCTIVIGVVAAGCIPPRQAVTQPGHLTVSVRYPTEKTSVAMGHPLQCIIEVADDQGNVMRDAQVTLTVTDAGGRDLGSAPAVFGAGDVYRSQAMPIAHKSQAGTWTLRVDASTAAATGTASVPFSVRDSQSEVLLQKYGFWVDAPRLKGIEPSLVKEQGNAANGSILWGGLLPTAHIFVENWLEVQWREGDFKLASADQVRAFMLGVLGNFGETPVRELGPFEQVRFKQWDAWLVKARGSLAQYDEQWMIFYAPEAGKTYAIGTTVALPPAGIDAHAALRDGFEVHPENQADGTAPEALPQLLPAPELTSPALAMRFLGTGKAIVLKWKPLKDLAEDEYYVVQVDYNYTETNTVVDYATRQTELRLPASLYDRPNCGIFNWQVTLMRRTSPSKDGQPRGEPISYNSLYWYVEWRYPPGVEAPFPPLCPNPQT